MKKLICAESALAVPTAQSRSFEPRRRLYHRSRRVLVGLLVGRLRGRRPALERAARGFLRDRPRRYLVRVVADRRFALAAVAALVASTTATALPPVNLSDVAAGTGGFVINGINGAKKCAGSCLGCLPCPHGDESGDSVSGAGDVNGDGLADLIVGAHFADPGGIDAAGESYVVFSPFSPPCPWDLDGDGNVFITDLLMLLMDFGTCDGSPADLDGDGCVTVLDLLTLIANFGPCPGAECVWDVNGDGIVDWSDVQAVISNLGPCKDPHNCPWDVNGDGVVDVQDVVEVVTHIGPCP